VPVLVSPVQHLSAALPCYLLGRDRSPSGPCLRRACSTAFHACRPGAFGEIAPPRRCLGEVGFSATQMSPRTSEVGTDLRAVRVRGGPISTVFHVPLRWRFRRNRPTSEVPG
jgi:hypothetical protein